MYFRPSRAQALLTLVASLGVARLRAQGGKADLTRLSIEDLVNVEITSVSKKEQKRFVTPAAVYVLTAEDIRRSGLTTVPDLLRMVPGMDVARISYSRWAVSARGFNGQYANKLLVMVDGRSLYTPVFGGVEWELMDYPLDEIERIEVIRGPGSAMWGANAVNGVVNLITKNAAETQGGMLKLMGGDEDRAAAEFRYGAKAGERGSWRASAKYFERAPVLAPDGPQDGNWDSFRAGYRGDWKLSGRDELSVQGGVQRGHLNQVTRRISSEAPFDSLVHESGPFQRAGASVQWMRNNGDGSVLRTQMNYTGVREERFGAVVRYGVYDFNVQDEWTTGERHNWIGGAQLRLSDIEIGGSRQIQLFPARHLKRLTAAFLQDEISLAPGRLTLTAGSKFEYRNIGGLAVEPGVQLAWTPTRRQTFWLSAARAVRSPSRVNHDSRLELASASLPSGDRMTIQQWGSEDFQPESMFAREAGARWQPARQFFFDASVFYNSYRNLETSEPKTLFWDTSSGTPHFVLPMVFENRMWGETYGSEVAANWMVSPRWRLTGSHTWLQANLHRDAVSQDSARETGTEGSSPHQSWQVRCQWDATRTLEVDTAVYFTGALPALEIPRYTRIDLRAGWKPTQALELEVAVQNLQNHRHLEFLSEGQLAPPSRIGRTARAGLVWRF